MATLYQLNREGNELGQQLKKTQSNLWEAENYLADLKARPNANPKDIALIESEVTKFQAQETALQAKIDDWTLRWRDVQVKAAEKAEQEEKAAALAAEQKAAAEKAQNPGADLQKTGEGLTQDQTAPAFTPITQQQTGETTEPITASTVNAQTVTNVDITTTDPSVNQDTLLSPEQSIAKAQVKPEPQDPQVLAADNVNNTNSAIREAITNNPVSSAGNNVTTGNNTAGSVDQVRKEAVEQAQDNTREQDDWRVRLQLATDAYDYLYNAAKLGDVLYPLQVTKGVIFPYTPQIQMGYKANYEAIDLVHNNYKQYFYKNSSVEDVVITCDFTAQDTNEADYLLAVMHFFRSVTKMFFGKDSSPRAGTPPPLCFLSGLGQYQFSDHPLLINSFTYTLPNDVDYIRAGSTTQFAGVNLSAYTPKPQAFTKSYFPALDRLRGSKLKKGGYISQDPDFQYLSNSKATYVPTKIQLQIGAYPIVTRKNTTNVFSVEKYATGELFKKGFW
jgi:hypothetical protein